MFYKPGRRSGFAGSSDTARCPALPLGQAACRTTARSLEHPFQSQSTFLLLALTWLFLNMEFSACKFTPFCNTSLLSSVDKPRELHLSSQRQSRTLQLPPGTPHPAPRGAAWPRLQPRARWGWQLPATPCPPPRGLPRGSGRPLMLGGPRGAGADPDSSDSGSELPSAILGQVPRLPAVVKPGMR